MYKVTLPISKSIANRILLMQAIHGDPLMRVSSDMPDDVIVLHDALEKIRAHKKGEPLTLYLKNCGTALRFLQVHLERCHPGEPIVLEGDPRLMERDGKPTTQTTSARILHGENVPAAENESPYITMSRRISRMYQPSLADQIESCWSSAAFWYEYVAIHGGKLELEGLKEDSLQGDRLVADIYALHFGVQTKFEPGGALIQKAQIKDHKSQIEIDFVNCIDLCPPIALTCERLGITLHATGTERLRYKECDRIEAVQKHEVRNDHRMAMALMCADYPVSVDEQKCIAKSYPTFVAQFNSLPSGRGGVGFITHITPIKGVNDDHLGKKHALSKLIHAATTEYVWLHDDDVELPKAAVNIQSAPSGQSKDTKELFDNADLIILPLRMETPSLERVKSSARSDAQWSSVEQSGVGLSLQIAEYAAIQELTMRMAKAGAPIMCSGANLIVRREAWLECEPDLHPEIPSGDDMFLLEAMKKRGMKIAVIDEPDYTAVVRPAPTWRAFFRQRMRWAGKASKYTDLEILRCGAFIVAVNLLQLLFPPFILIKFLVEYSIILQREPHTKWYVALLLEILYPFYMLISLLGGLFRQKKW